MTAYKALINQLFSLNRSNKKTKNLEGAKALAAAIGNPHERYPTVHIAGTNGKGSVLCKVGEALRLAGYRVGLFTSPHIFSYRERIVVDQKMITEEAVVEGLEKLFCLSKEQKIEPKFFELTTLLAFDYFAQQQVDIALIETGLGGRLDTTNIINPLVSVITTVDFDHQEILGYTLDEIAFEKGGIIKNKTPVVIGPRAPQKVLRRIAREKKAPLYFVEMIEDDNQNIALKVLEVLSSHFAISSQAKQEGVKKLPRCRFEACEEDIVIDIAHNQQAFARLFHQLSLHFPQRPISLLFSCSKDKKISSFVELFHQNVSEIGLFPISHVRLKGPDEIGRELKKSGYKKWRAFPAVSTAVKTLLNSAKKQGGILLIAGSFYMMKEIFQSLSQSSDLKLSTSLNIM